VAETGEGWRGMVFPSIHPIMLGLLNVGFCRVFRQVPSESPPMQLTAVVGYSWIVALCQRLSLSAWLERRTGWKDCCL